MTAAAELRGVALRYAGLRGVDLALPRGEITALLGPSGSGKSSLLRLLMGLVAPDSGTVLVGGRESSVTGRVLVPPEARGLGVVFQDLALWPHLTVRGNLAFGLRARGVAPEAREQRIASALAQVALAGKVDARPGELSGGERQRVAVARALVLEPEILLFDEPLSNLDVALKDELLALLAGVLRGRTALHVTHDPREAEMLAHRIAFLEDGRITQVGPVSEVLAAPTSDFAGHVARAVNRSRTSAGRAE